MKKYLLIFLLTSPLYMSAQTILKGDMNDDGIITVADVTSLVNVILGKEQQQTINVGCDPYDMDNSLVVGTWYAPDSTSFTLNEDGTTNVPDCATYEFYPMQGNLLFLNAAGESVRVIHIVKATSSYLQAVDYATQQFTYYTRAFRKTFTVSGVSFNMIKVEKGTFQMGSDNWFGPAHEVTLTNDFYIGETEVTQELWTAVMGENPSTYTGSGQMPLEHASWNSCQTFLAKLNELTGLAFRMPTEAEWEFAARGGNASKGFLFCGSDTYEDVAWCWQTIPSQTNHTPGYGPQLVATKAPNELGIFDMSGNVSEWCQDWYQENYSSEPQVDPTGPETGNYRVNRGGNWHEAYAHCRITDRLWYKDTARDSRVGLRLVL